MINVYTATGYKSKDPVVVIPAKVGRYPVVAVAQYAFCYQYHITSLTVEEGVGKIEYGAFWGCGNLKEVHLPAGIAVERNAFYHTRVERQLETAL